MKVGVEEVVTVFYLRSESDWFGIEAKKMDYVLVSHRTQRVWGCALRDGNDKGNKNIRLMFSHPHLPRNGNLKEKHALW